MTRTIHRAKFVLADSDLLLQNAAVYVSEPGRISRVEAWDGRREPGWRIFDWGSAVIMPGLVNAHAHLELTSLSQRIRDFSSFTDWLWQLIQLRNNWKTEDYLASSREGARLCVANGTTLVGDISSSGLSWRALKIEKLRKVVFEEILGLSPDKLPERLSSLKARISAVEPDERLRIGISPHAPYTVSPELYQAIGQTAAQSTMLVATHVAETEPERRFLMDGTGEFHDFLARMEVLPADWTPPGVPPLEYLEKLGVLHNLILIHCNYLDSDSASRILEGHSSVVYCPRSSAFFGHKNHPVRQLLDMGVNVALGTDSLASNDSLSILDEMRFLSRLRKDLKAEEIIRLATLNGAAALGFGGQLGRLARGYWADMTVLDLPENAGGRNMAQQILEGAGTCVGTVVEGDVAWTGPERV